MAREGRDPASSGTLDSLSEQPVTEEHMPNFTIKNLKDVEDSAAGRGPGMEARFARKHIDSEHLGVSYFRYGPNHRSAMGHRHREQEEA
jgi:hypothetical protein